MRKISNLLIVFILICLIVGNVSTVYGEKSEELEDIKDKAFDLGYKDGEKDGSKYFKDTPYYKVLPNEDEIIYIFKREYRRDYDSKYNSTIIRYYEYGFEEGYNSNVKDDKDKKEDNLNYPKTLGRILGEICGYRDFYDGKKSNWSRAIPSDRKLREMYNLDMETSRYRTAFLGIFKDSFEEGYKVGYEKANLEPIAISYEQGIKDGTTIGQMKGEYAAIIDITLGNTNYWTRHKIKDSVIIDEYGLKFQSDNYQMAFVIGYWEGFIESYNETYNKLQLDRNKVKTYTERIPIDGKNNIGIPGDDKFLVDIEPGTYYNDVIVTIDSIPTSYVNPNTNRHTQASGVYSLKIMNLSNKFDDNKKTTIKFKSYGNNVKYGIYKYHYNKWVYIPSRQEGDYLVAGINLKNIDSFGNVYVVRVDNELPCSTILEDIGQKMR